MGLGQILYVSDDASNDLNRLFPSISATTVGPVTPETGSGLGYPAAPPPRRDPGVAGMGAIVPWPRLPYEWDLIRGEVWTNNTPFKDTTAGMGDVPVYSGPTQAEVDAAYSWNPYVGQYEPRTGGEPGRPQTFTLATWDPHVWLDPRTGYVWVTPGYGSFDASTVFGTNPQDPKSAYHLPAGVWTPPDAAAQTTARIAAGGPATLYTGTETLYGVNGRNLQPPPAQGSSPAATGTGNGTTPPAADTGVSVSSIAMIGAAVLVGLMALKR